ncbi:DinB family protein [Paenibacillus sonchi]|uniref:DinB family protein n=1 Tax=Paenibacillus sonchi TaxID=373687 RepID=UPI001E496AF1|nr:DinB family protein [Paenibacillus sonchi]MCE3203407.1 DinB family protein [Paenibacillus sonchi]
MKTLFQYNWQVRNDWFSWCEDVPEDELLKARIGGVEGILKTLYHIVYWEYSWINSVLQGKAAFEQEPFEAHRSLRQVRDLSIQFHAEVEPFVTSWTSEMEHKELTLLRDNGEWITYKHGEIIRHVIAHEIHHIGQLSVWAREIGREPITANLLRRGLFN